jgi:hypothetical protein
MITRGFELMQISRDDVNTLNMTKGHYQMGSDRILYLNKPLGFEIYRLPLDDIIIKPGDITLDKSNNMFSLEDLSGKQLMRTYIGLLPTTYVLDEKECPDLSINGIHIYTIIKNQLFSESISLTHFTKSQLLTMIDDLIVRKPSVSPITMQRLDLPENYDIIDKFPTDFTEIMENKKEDVSDDDLFMGFLMLDNDKKDFLKNLKIDSNQDSWLDPNFDVQLVTNLTEERITYQTTKILKRILGLKYHIIAHMLTPISSLSYQTINLIDSQFENDYILYSLIYVYDELFTDKESPSPKDTILQINQEFLSKFNLTPVRSRRW